ncbi:hypothetical protein EGI31_12760 [Lacihabitans soyangensis]|uniref:Uncharacterized protein n=1 Tax=Lacihabitans soyangensis TaxID=869394 RepID=A0AAE3H4B5_9BACT|nr:hypothetical protein [Lacihabitans soyangensis]
MKVYGLIKELQAELITGKDLPHLVSVRLLARLDEAERHLGFGWDAAHSAQPPVEAPQPERRTAPVGEKAPQPERRTAPVGELAVEADKEVDGGSVTPRHARGRRSSD